MSRVSYIAERMARLIVGQDRTKTRGLPYAITCSYFCASSFAQLDFVELILRTHLSHEHLARVDIAL